MSETRDKLLARKRPLKTWSESYLGETVTVKELTADERLDVLGSDGAAGGKTTKLMARLLEACVHNGDGKPLLSASDWSGLFNCEFKDTLDFGNRILDLQGMSARAVDTAVGNSEGSQSG